MKTLKYASVLLLAIMAAALQTAAQPGGGPGRRGGMGMGPGNGPGMAPETEIHIERRGGMMADKMEIRRSFFPPEMIMRFSDKLEITKEQRDFILKTHNEAQGKLNTLHWDLRDASDALEKIVDQDKVDAGKAREALAKVIDMERQIKTTQMEMLIAVKNKLTDKQIAELKELRKKQMDRMEEHWDDRGGMRKERKVRRVIIDEDGDDDDAPEAPKKN